MFTQLYYEDFQQGAIRETSGRTVTATDLAFHRQHLKGADVPVATASVHEPLPVPATLVFTFTIGLTAMGAPINGAAFTYGYDRLQFPIAVKTGDTLHVRVTVAECTPDPKRKNFGRVIERCQTLNQRGEVVFSCDHVLMVERRPLPAE